jgi:putative spermidine/putrescine transport system ATP-binding protein
MALADLVVVMSNGRIEQVGAPRDVYNRPATHFVARFIGGHNVLLGRVAALRDGQALIDGPADGHIAVPAAALKEGDEVELALRADRIQLRPAGAQGSADAVDSDGPPHNEVTGSVASVEYRGASVAIRLDIAGQDEFEVMLTESAFDHAPVEIGQRLTASWAPEHVHSVGA